MVEHSPPSLLTRYLRLIEITRDLASTLDLDTLLNRIVWAAADVSEAQAASILLYDESKGQLKFEAATNLDEPLMRGLNVPVDASLAGWIVTNREPVLISNAQKDSRHFSEIAKVTKIETESLLGVPLITKNKVVGVLEAINKNSGDFSYEDQDLLSALGSAAAVAIENAFLFQQSDLIAEMVHELRTPLASISTAAELLLHPDILEEQRIRMVHIIHDETYRLSEMATSFLDLALLESGRARFHTEVFDLVGLLEDCYGFMRNRAKEKDLHFTYDLPNQLPPLHADRNKIKQVILNLLSNAIKYNYPSGMIQMSAAVMGDGICIFVTNSGPVIPVESIPHLFEKFYREPGAEQMASGTGLGLSICKGIVEAHGGSIQVKSDAGHGTTFKVCLPMTPAG